MTFLPKCLLLGITCRFIQHKMFQNPNVQSLFVLMPFYLESRTKAHPKFFKRKGLKATTLLAFTAVAQKIEKKILIGLKSQGFKLSSFKLFQIWYVHSLSYLEIKIFVL